MFWDWLEKDPEKETEQELCFRKLPQEKNTHNHDENRIVGYQWNRERLYHNFYIYRTKTKTTAYKSKMISVTFYRS